MSKVNMDIDIAIIGGGAAGLAAAVSAGRKNFYEKKNKRIVIVDKEKRVGKKLLATGNGRCNLTNENMSEEFYNGSCKKLVADILQKYDTDSITAFFNSIGIACKSDTQGRVYPNSEQASAVLDLLRINAARFGVNELCETCVQSITPMGRNFKIDCDDKVIYSKNVILATGGKAQPKLGSNGSTYKFAKMLDLKCSSIFPSLAPVKVQSEFIPFLKGVRTSANVMLMADGRLVHKESGELQFAQSGLSGICIFQLSRFVNEFFAAKTVKGKSVKDISVIVDLMPGFTLDELENFLFKRKKQLSFITLDEFFTGLLNKKIGQCLLKELKLLPLTKTADKLRSYEIVSLAKLIKSWQFVPSGMSEMDLAQVTAGGIISSEIDENMRCSKYGNLYIAGEALDADGLCGGYNLHWAFASGIIAGISAFEGACYD